MLSKNIAGFFGLENLFFSIFVLTWGIVSCSVNAIIYGSNLSDYEVGSSLLSSGFSYPMSYPMWGYPITAAIFANKLLFVQFIILFLTLLFWRMTLSKLIIWKSSSNLNLIKKEFICSILLLPIIILATSYTNYGICYILLFGATWSLYYGVKSEKGLMYFALPGVLFGLSYNFRTEIFLIFLILLIVTFIYMFTAGTKVIALKKLLILIFASAILLTPYQIYGKKTLGHMSLFTSNGGGVAYLGLGALKSNPWQIIPSDQYVSRIASENGYESPWSIHANKFFMELFFKSVVAEPVAFSERVLFGSLNVLSNSFYLPNLRRIFSNSENDYKNIDFLNESIRKSLHMNYNRQEYDSYVKSGTLLKSNKIFMVLILLFEYLIKLFYFFAFIYLLFNFFVYYKYNDKFLSLIVTSQIFFTFALGSAVQSTAAHTTMLLPLLVSTLIIRKQYTHPVSGMD